MRRREFITLLGGAAVAWPLVSRAGNPDRVARIGVLMPNAENEPGLPDIAAFEQRLAERGWTDGRNIRIDYRWGVDSTEKTKAAIAELLALNPDVVVTDTSRAVAELQRATQTVPIVFMMIYEPVGQGFVHTLAHPGGNTTGFTIMEATIGAKWLQLLKEMAPTLTRVAYMCNPSNPGPMQAYEAVEVAAHSQAVATALAPVHTAAEIETAMATLAREPGGALIVPPDGFLLNHVHQIIWLAARDRLPAIYGTSFFATEGGLASYGINGSEQFRQAAEYVDRILRGEKAAELPVQQPTKYELIVNLKTAKALGLEVSPTLLARADEVIE
jgi:putative tryptophan/tyrosine transport system substrate-binding protein